MGVRSASVVLPTLQNWAALHDAGANCTDLDGNSIGDHSFWTIALAKDLGTFAICWCEISDEGWELVLSGYNDERPAIFGFSIEEFAAACQKRFDDLFALLSTSRPDAAGALTHTAATASSEVRNYLLPITYSDAFIQSLRVWFVARLGGSQTQQYPTVLLDPAKSADVLFNNSTDLDGLKTLWTRWNSEDETSDLRLVLRLWEYAQMGILVDALAA